MDAWGRRNYRSSRRWLLVPLAIGVVSVAAFVDLSLHFYGMSPPPYAYWPWFPFGWFIFIPVIFFAFFAFRWFCWGGWGWGWGYDPAVETLRQRYARGEVSESDYDRMMKELGR